MACRYPSPVVLFFHILFHDSYHYDAAHMLSFCTAEANVNEFASGKMTAGGHVRFEVHDEAVSVSVSVLGGRIIRLLGWHRQVDRHPYATPLCGQMENQHIPRLPCLYFGQLN
jgi:hypothetical protein